MFVHRKQEELERLTWGQLDSRLRETAPEPHPTSKHVCTVSPELGLFFRSVSTSSTSSWTHTHNTVVYSTSEFYSVCVCVLPQSQVLVWRQEASWSGSDPWSPIPGSRTALASCSTNRRWREIKWTCNDWTVNRLMMLALCKYYVINESMWSTVLVWSEYLDRRLVQSFQICSVFSRLRNSVNFLCSRLSIWQKKQNKTKKTHMKKTQTLHQSMNDELRKRTVFPPSECATM